MSIIQPQLNALFVQADNLQSLADTESAEKLRMEAIKLSTKYLSKLHHAETERSRASTLIDHGRFNEALVALSLSRDLFRVESMVVEFAETTIALANILQWLGDYNRAMIEIRQAESDLASLIGGRSVQGLRV